MADAAITALLLQAAGVTTLCGSRITQQRRAQGAGLPAVVLHQISDVRSRRLNGEVSMRRARLQIDCWGRTFAEARALAAAVIAALDKARFIHPSADVRGVFLIEADDDVPPDTPEVPAQPFRTRLDFMVHHTPV